MTSVIPVQCFYPTALTSQLGAGQFVGTHNYIWFSYIHTHINFIMLVQKISNRINQSPFYWFFPLLSSHVCLMLFWYCKEKFCLGHSWELTWLVTNQKFMSKPLMHWHVTSQNNLPRVPSLHQVMTTEEYWVHAGLHQELYSCLFLVVLQQEVQLSLRELIKIHCQ